MRLLYFAPHRVWPLTTGARLRDYHLARQLAARAHVTFLELCHPGEEAEQAPADLGIQRILTVYKGASYTPSKIIRGLIGPSPITVLNCYSERIVAGLREFLKPGSFDSIHLVGIQLSQYLPLIRELCGPAAVISDWHNVESELLRRYAERASNPLRALAARRTASLLERMEIRLLPLCEAHTATSERDLRQLREWSPGANLHVIENGVDVAYYRGARPSSTDQPTLLFVGSMDYHANIDAVRWFVREAWPAIANRHPRVKFVIAGRNPASAVRALASDRIRVTGTVEDVRPFYRSASAVVVPLRVGSGTRLKILEAMAASVPVVSTALGAEGLDATPGRDLLIADSPAEIIESTDRLLSSPAARESLGAAAHALVSEKYDWAVIGEKLFRVHQQVALGAQAAS